MAFFRFRQRSASDPKATSRSGAAASTETVQSLRRRARHRLVGAAVLVLLAVIGFPMLFDTEPRPVVIDAPITIPDRESAPPLKPPAAAPAPVPTEAPVTAKPAEAAATTQTPHSEPPPAAAAATAQADEAARARREADAQARREREAKAQAQREQEARAKREEEAARARAALEGRSAPVPKPPSAAANDGGRFIVQIGAFAEADKVQDARRKAERAGLKTYTQVAETPDGKRTRVRVGPFQTRADAEKAAETLKKIGLPGAILSL